MELLACPLVVYAVRVRLDGFEGDRLAKQDIQALRYIGKPRLTEKRTEPPLQCMQEIDKHVVCLWIVRPCLTKFLSRIGWVWNGKRTRCGRNGEHNIVKNADQCIRNTSLPVIMLGCKRGQHDGAGAFSSSWNTTSRCRFRS